MGEFPAAEESDWGPFNEHVTTLIQYVNTIVSVKLSMYNYKLGNKATSVTCTLNLLLLGKRKTLMIKIIYVKKKKRINHKHP